MAAITLPLSGEPVTRLPETRAEGIRRHLPAQRIAMREAYPQAAPHLIDELARAGAELALSVERSRPVVVAECSIVDLAGHVAAQADTMDHTIRLVDLHADALRARWATNQQAYWARRDAEKAVA